MAIYDTLLPGDLMFTRDEGVVGRLIRFGERVKYLGWVAALKLVIKGLFSKTNGPPEAISSPSFGNHIAVVVDNGQIIQALGKGLELDVPQVYADGQFGVLPLAKVKPDVTDANRADLVRFARKELNRKDGYGWFGIASIVVQLLTPFKLDVSWDGTMICSCFGARCWEHAGVSLDNLSPFTCLPTDLAVLTGELFAGTKAVVPPLGATK